MPARARTRRAVAVAVAALALAATSSTPAAARCTAVGLRYRLGGSETTLYRNGCVADIPVAGGVSGSQRVGTGTHYVTVDYTLPLP